MKLWGLFQRVTEAVSWWDSPAWPLLVVMWAIAGGVLLHVSGRYLARLKQATLARSLGANVVTVLVQSIAVLLAMHFVAALVEVAKASARARQAAAMASVLVGATVGLGASWACARVLFRTTWGKAAKAASLPVVVLAVFYLPLVLSIAADFPKTAPVLNPNRCMQNLYSIGLAICRQRDDHFGRMPPHLAVLNDPNLPKSAFLCPLRAASVPTSGPAGVLFWAAPAPARKYDYFYRPPDANAPSQALIACDFQGNHPDGTRCVLYVSLYTQCLTPKQFDWVLARAENAAFAQALQAAEKAQRASPSPTTQPAKEVRKEKG